VLMKEKTGGLVYALYGNSDAATANRPAVDVFIGSDAQVRGTATLPVGSWSHLAATYDGATMRLFVNGTQVASRALAGAMTASTGAFRIGGNSIFSPAERFKGLIDDVRVYDRPLTSAQISADMSTPVK
jgi:hypothetical protein